MRKSYCDRCSTEHNVVPAALVKFPEGAERVTYRGAHYYDLCLNCLDGVKRWVLEGRPDAKAQRS